ncbi:Zinc transporter ZupT [Candidatus Kinetoplastibacterium sorsogonicusi]|uniref:Zinc transporter ZupT n=1 Tax=Candidatus Kinetoplastidibacterium kentomonadis TaxID=1576550 RepID=A0A3Q8ETR4_9PROT|nr:ZIP family metal transporter [Candidatus Kinetoplastibacterium sorsogonicusi]AWD32507.1 Zinc transporter ZupT [Candidatus Kinetoplastibacterium sorsogonicusi]
MLFYIFISTISSGIIALIIANFLTYAKIFSKYLNNMVSFSVGVLLSVSLLHLLPEAYDHYINDSHLLFTIMLISFIFLFSLEKISLLRHNHHHEGDGHNHISGYDQYVAGKGGYLLLIGSSLHNLSDGILISAAFLSNTELGWLTSISIMVHEIPHKLSDFIVLRNAGINTKNSYILILGSSLFSILGGCTGYYVLKMSEIILPYCLVIAASSFIYIAIADLMPQMNEKTSFKEVIFQLMLVIFGILLIFFITNSLHGCH